MSDNTGDFARAEYHEAANAYFKGVDIGWTTVRGYITVNVLFVALIGAISEPKATVILPASDIVKAVPWVALFVSLVLILALPYYFRHLENCRRRCEEIEKGFGGSLFTRLGVISRGRTQLTTAIALLLIIGTVSLFWGYFAAKGYDPNFQLQNFQLFEVIKGLIG